MTAADLPVFDAHVDSIQRALDLGHDLAGPTPGHLDLNKGAAGGLGAAVLTAWVDPSYIGAPGGGAAGRARALIGALQDLVRRAPDEIEWASTGRDVERIRAMGRVAAISGIEGGHAIEESLETLQDFFEYGVRVLTLVWNNHLPWIRSCQPQAGADVPAGLSPFGRQVVRRMNQLGMVVDVSHAAERAVREVLEVSQFPVIASHSACSALNDHPRNLSDTTLRAIAQHGGVLGMVFCTPFLSQAARAEEARLRQRAEYRALAGRNATETDLLQSAYLQEQASPFPLSTVVAHLLHAIDVMGIDYVGIGSDYDGIQRTPAELRDASCYPALAQALRQAGLSQEDVEKVFWRNMARVFDRCTGPGTAATTQNLRPVACLA